MDDGYPFSRWSQVARTSTGCQVDQLPGQLGRCTTRCLSSTATRTLSSPIWSNRVHAPDGVPHLAKGMLKPLQVTPAPAPATANTVDARGTFTLKDFSFEMPDRLPAGLATYKVVNVGPQIHELNLLKLAPGKSLDDALDG